MSLSDGAAWEAEHGDDQKNAIAVERRVNAGGVSAGPMHVVGAGGPNTPMPYWLTKATLSDQSIRQNEIEALRGQVARLRTALLAVCPEAIVDLIQKG